MSDFSQQIVQRIQTTKPRSRQWFLIINIFYILVLVLAVFFGICSLALFINNFWDLWLLQQQGFLTVESIFDFLVEFVLASILLASLAYFVYRQTEWPIVRQKYLLISTITGVVLFGALVVTWLIDHESSLNTKRSIANSVMYRPKREDYIRDRMNKRNVFVGRLESMDKDKVVVKNPREIRTFYTTKATVLPKKELQKLMVVVKFKPTEKGILVAESVNILLPSEAPINDLEFRPVP